MNAVEKTFGSMINREGHRSDTVCCAMCENHKVKAASVCPWFAPDSSVVVCVYGVCEECTNTMLNLPGPLQSKMADKIENQLIARHPQILSRLPEGYLHIHNENDN